ncbi:MAG: hypothetical protein CSB46_08205 [Micrococcales bacterium]|nr:MAG: hypothetical protein CSB46_08205 [Micrococcales bacterium]
MATTVNPAAVWGTPVALVAGFALAASLVRPWRPRPPVHDRQLDVILAVPFISLAAWMLLWWPLIDERRTPTDAGIVTVVAFTAAVVLLVLGTRTAGQLSPALLPGLVALPSLATNGWLVLSAIAVSGWLMFRRSEHPTRAQQIHLPACERAWVTVVVLGSLTLTLSLVDLLR